MNEFLMVITIPLFLAPPGRSRYQETLEKIMTTTAFDDQFTTASEPVRQPYDTASILRRNVADLELALRTQTERAEAAEAEMAKLAKQEPVAYVKYKATGGNVGLAWMAIPTAAFYPREGEKLYVTPVPAPHKGATHCDGCGLTWLDDGLNPLGCPYCKDTVPAPAVPAEIMALSKKYAIDTDAYHAAMDALLQSAEVRHD